MCVLGAKVSSDGYIRVPIKPEAFRCLRLAKNRLMFEVGNTKITYSDVIMYMYRKVFGNGQ